MLFFLSGLTTHWHPLFPSHWQTEVMEIMHDYEELTGSQVSTQHKNPEQFQSNHQEMVKVLLWNANDLELYGMPGGLARTYDEGLAQAESWIMDEPTAAELFQRPQVCRWRLSPTLSFHPLCPVNAFVHRTDSVQTVPFDQTI